MNDIELQALVTKIFTKRNGKLNQRTGSHLMNLVKAMEHNTVLRLQLIGELKRGIRQEVYRNSGVNLEL